MKILGMGIPELLIILAVIVIIFGAKFLPKLGAATGKAIKGLRDGMNAGEKENEEEVVEKAVASEPKATVTEAVADESAAPKKKRVVKRVVKA